MPMARPERPRRGVLPLALTLLLCGALSVLHRQSERARGHDPVTGFVRDAALVPAEGVTLRVGRWWRLHVSSVFAGPRLARQNAALQAQVSVLTLQDQRLLAAQAENARLRVLLHYEKKAHVPLLAAEVVALKPSTQTDTLILDRGARDGVEAQTTVLGPNGALAGQVLEASPASCVVLLLTDSGSSVGALASRRGKAGPVGICQGDRAGHLVLTDLPRQGDVRPGDAVSTSGLGGVYPKGVRIGTVLSVVFDKTRSLKTALVRPTVDFDHLEDVFLLSRPAPAPPDTSAPPDVSAPPGPMAAPQPGSGAAPAAPGTVPP